jgi:Carboxypeptidase regulatory-like domain/TonB dependent receptor
MSRVLLISVLSAAIAVPMFGQVAGRLTGSVVDPSGASVADASVNLFLPGGKSPVLSTHTTSEGNFDFSAVRPDTYRLEVQAKGFGDYAQGGVAIDPARQTSLPPIHLQLQTTTQLVEVTASANTIDTNTIEVSSTVTQEQVMNLPVLDRQINNLFYTQPGVNFNGSADTVINGLRAQNTNVTLDGVNIQDNFIRINGLDFLPNKLTIGEVSELTVSTSNLSPTIGGNANAITLSTPSGTNVYHGSVYWYNRNNFFSSNDWFNNRDGVAKPFLNLNQFGGTIGGPIKKDKLLFYAAYETFDLHQTTPTTTTILSPLARQGILQYRTNGTGAIQQFNVLQNPGATPAPLKIDPFIAGLLAAVPTTANNTSVGDGLNTLGYSFNARSNERRDSVIGKLDYNLSPTHVFSGTFRWNRDNVDRPDIGSFYTAVPPVSNQDNAKFFSANWRWSPTATLTNEVRGGGNLTINPFVVGGTPPPFFVTGAIMTNPVNTFLPQGRDTNTYNLQDNANWIHGKHSVSFGFQTQQARVAAFNSAGIVPSYTLGVFSANDPYGYGTGDIPGATATDTGTGNALVGTLAGLISAATQSYNVTSQTSGFVPGAQSKQNMSFNDYALYATDSWKITHRLTAVLGVRWDYFPPVAETNNLLIQPQLINNNPVQTLLGNASLTFQGTHLYNSDWNNFAPHVGLAYDPFGKGKTVIRGGYTISYAQDDMLEAVLNTATANSGLTGASSILNAFAFTAAPPKLTTPAFQIPISTQQNFVNTGGNNVQGLIDPNLRTPYVQQWNLSVQHEWKGMVFEGAYIGNHAVKLMRQIDFNQINVNQSSFVQDFKNARNNGLLALASASKVFNPAYNPAIPGSVPLPFFNGLTSAGGLSNTTVRTDILSNQIGALAQFYQQANVFPTNNPAFSYFPNPLALYSSELTNYSNSSYNGLQTQVRRRARNGMQFQVSYVFSKALSDTSVERGLDAILDNNNPSIEKARAPWDLTHSFKVNHYIPIPLGKGHRYNYGPLDWLISDWAVSGFVTVNSGAPISILSARGTLNRTARSGQNTVDTTDTLSQLQSITGMFMTGNGPYFVNPSAIGPNGTGAAADGSAPFAGQVFFNPGAATVGSLQRRLLSGPWYDNYNFEVQKKFQFTERQSIQLKADFYNLFNHPNFFAGDQNINSVNFGKITSMFTSAEGVSARVMQFGLFYRF